MLRRDLQELTAQLKKAPDSAAQPATDLHPAAPNAGAEARGQPSVLSKPGHDMEKSAKAGTGGVGESGLPSPSLPGTPHSPGDSPTGESQSYGGCCACRSWLPGGLVCWVLRLLLGRLSWNSACPCCGSEQLVLHCMWQAKRHGTLCRVPFNVLCLQVTCCATHICVFHAE